MNISRKNRYFYLLLKINILYTSLITFFVIFDVFQMQEIWVSLIWFTWEDTAIITYPPILYFFIKGLINYFNSGLNSFYEEFSIMLLCIIVDVIIYFLIMYLVFIPFLYKGEF